MKAIILAGGKGTRLRPLTYKIPKALIPVQGKTLTEHVIGVLKKLDIDEIILSISYMADKIKEYFGNGSKFNLKVSYAVEKEPMGTAGPLIMLPKIKETFVMVNGDNLFNLDFKKMLELHKKNKATATIALTEIGDTTHYGVARLEGDKILEFIEKPKKEEASGRYINSGYYILEPDVFDIIKGKGFAMMEKDIFPKLAKEGKLFGYRDNGQWFDTGTLENYERVKKEWKGVE